MKTTAAKCMDIGKFFIVLGAVLIFYAYAPPYDSTDDEANKIRSGMGLYTDHMTGCQYLKAGMFGGLVKRVDGDGRHVGCL